MIHDRNGIAFQDGDILNESKDTCTTKTEVCSIEDGSISTTHVQDNLLKSQFNGITMSKEIQELSWMLQLMAL